MSYVVSEVPGAKIRSFTDLYAWQEGHKLVLMIYEITAQFPSDERFGIANQLRRAAVSVTSNIAEGFRRNTRRDKQQFYTFSLSSLTEIQNQLIIVRDVKYIDQNTFQKIADQSVRAAKLIKGILRSAESRSAA